MISADLRYHLDKAKGKLNAQGLARREKLVVGVIKPDPGYVTASSDAAAGEPSLTAHFSRDPNYLYACFDGVGKAPEYRNGILMIDDIYLMTMSVSPIGRQKMREAFDRKWPAGSFQDQWLSDSEVIKSSLKKDRQLHKILALGLGYSMKPKKMVSSMYDQGYDLAMKDAKEFYNAYWQLFAGVKKLSDKLCAKVERDGYLVNPFGYRLVPEPHKSFNYFIQSGVSGLLNVYMAKLFSVMDYAKFSTIIHDELVFDVPEDKIEQCKKDKEIVVKSLNEDLKWSIDVRMGLVFGKTWYEAK